MGTLFAVESGKIRSAERNIGGGGLIATMTIHAQHNDGMFDFVHRSLLSCSSYFEPLLFGF